MCAARRASRHRRADPSSAGRVGAEVIDAPRDLVPEPGIRQARPSPSLTKTSLWQIPQASPLIRSCPRPGAGIRRSTSSNCPPGLPTCTAFVGPYAASPSPRCPIPRPRLDVGPDENIHTSTTGRSRRYDAAEPRADSPDTITNDCHARGEPTSRALQQFRTAVLPVHGGNQRTRRRTSGAFATLTPMPSAGLDVGATFHVVAVPPSGWSMVGVLPPSLYSNSPHWLVRVQEASETMRRSRVVRSRTQGRGTLALAIRRALVVRFPRPRRSRRLFIERLPILHTTFDELRPLGYLRHRIRLLRQEPPEGRMVPMTRAASSDRSRRSDRR